LTEILLDLFDEASRQEIEGSRTHCFHLIGSVIADIWIGRAARNGAVAVFWGCGYRGEPLTFSARHYRCYGVRGKLTEAFLGRQGLAIGDPALACPLLMPIPEQTRKEEILLVPHWDDRAFANAACRIPQIATALDRERVAIMSPLVRNKLELQDAVRRIAQARFVLAGAMHAAILALAYGVPFAFYRTAADGHHDCPVKWHDFASLHGFEPHFVSSYEAGAAWQSSIAGSLTYPPLQRLLQAAPGWVKEEYLEMAREIDLKRVASGRLVAAV
jgi:hypothetical protein